MGRRFDIRREVVLPASPEQVFEAVTTGQANWMFPVPAIPQPQAWEPPGRYEVRVDGEDGWFNALEYVIEAREGGTAVLRYVHSGVFADDWDDQYDGASKHTDFYLHTLGQYLAHFAGRSATYLSASGPGSSRRPDALETLKGALGLTGDAREGDIVRLDLPGCRVEASVDYLSPYFVGLRGPDALYRFFGRNHFGGTVDAAHHLFAPDTDGAKAEQSWRDWMEGVFAS
jgi:hypothetical protein